MTNEIAQNSTDLSLQLFDVWRLPFEFAEKPGVFKNRPVIVGDIDEDSVEIFIVTVKVTSHAPRINFPGEVPLLDWHEAGLPKPSTARCSQIARVPKSFFEGRIKYGKLSQRDSEAVERALIELGMVSRVLLDS